MRYQVIVASPSSDRRDAPPKHRVMYDGDSLEAARTAARHYTRPIDRLSAEVVQIATEEDGLGWIGQRPVAI